MLGLIQHRRRSVAVCINEDGERLWWRRWYWAADVIAEAGGRVHLAHPLGSKAFENRRVKNDLKDATWLADLLRMGRLPEAWIPPGSVRQLRELVRYRHRLNQLRSGLKSQIHGVLGKEGVIPELKWLWGPGGSQFLDELQLGPAYQVRIESLRELIEVCDQEIIGLDRRIHHRLRDDPRYRAILTGVGPVFAGVFCAEVGDVSRFRRPEQLCSWAGLTPRLRESDTKTIQGSFTKQGSRLVRWAALESVTRFRGGEPHPRRLPPDRGAAWHQPRQGGCRQKASHAGLLRAP